MFWECYADLKYPVMPMSYFRNRGFVSLVMCATVASMFYYSAVLLWYVLPFSHPARPYPLPVLR